MQNKKDDSELTIIFFHCYKFMLHIAPLLSIVLLLHCLSIRFMLSRKMPIIIYLHYHGIIDDIIQTLPM